MYNSHLLLHGVLMSHDKDSMLRILLPDVVQEHLLLPLHMYVLHYEVVHLAVSAAAAGIALR